MSVRGVSEESFGGVVRGAGFAGWPCVPAQGPAEPVSALLDFPAQESVPPTVEAPEVELVDDVDPDAVDDLVALLASLNPTPERPGAIVYVDRRPALVS